MLKIITEQECIEEFCRIIGVSAEQITAKTKSCSDKSKVQDYNGVLLDYEDLKATLLGRDLIINFTIKAKNIEIASKKMKQFINECKAKNMPFNALDGILVYFTMNDNSKKSFLEIIQVSIDELNSDANIIFGSKIDTKLIDNYIRIDVFISYKLRVNYYVNNIDYSK